MKGEYRTLNQRGNRFRDYINDTFRTENTPLLATGVGSIICLHWLKGALGDSPITPSKIGEVFDSTRQDFLQAALFEQGIFGYHGLGGISFAHTDKDIQMTQEALFQAIVEVNALDL